MEINDVSGNETGTTETSEALDNAEDEIVDSSEASDSEQTVLYEAYDYTSDLAVIKAEGFIMIAVLIAIGCIIAWIGARRE